MREFKNSKARKLFLESLKIDEEIDRMQDEEMNTIGYTDEYTNELKCQAAGLRVLADDIEDGIVNEEEAEFLI